MGRLGRARRAGVAWRSLGDRDHLKVVKVQGEGKGFGWFQVRFQILRLVASLPRGILY